MKINAVLLAAGNSIRFGNNKLLYGYNGKLMYRHILDTVLSIDYLLHNIIIVTQYDEIIAQVAALPVNTVKNNNPEAGMPNSIKLGMEMDLEAEAWLFLNCDQPHIKAETIKGFLKEFQESKKGIGCIQCKDYYGNPAIFSRDYEKELLSLVGDVGGKRVINQNTGDVYFHKCFDPSEFLDYDRLEELES